MDLLKSLKSRSHLYDSSSGCRFESSLALQLHQPSNTDLRLNMRSKGVTSASIDTVYGQKYSSTPYERLSSLRAEDERPLDYRRSTDPAKHVGLDSKISSCACSTFDKSFEQCSTKLAEIVTRCIRTILYSFVNFGLVKCDTYEAKGADASKSQDTSSERTAWSLEAAYASKAFHATTDITLYEWEVPDMISTRLDLEDQHETRHLETRIESLLKTSVILSGQGDSIQASDLESYLARRWGDSTKAKLLQLIVTGLAHYFKSASLEINPERLEASPVQDLVCYVTRPYLVLYSQIPRRDTLADGPVLFLCEALRSHQGVDFTLGMSRLQSDVFYFGLRSYELTPLYDATRTSLTTDSCWTQLFNKAVIVHDHAHHESDGVGLEVGFDLMVSLAGVEYVGVVDADATLDEATDGVPMILLGYYTALIPTKWIDSGTSIQWHFVCSEKLLTPHDLQEYPVLRVKDAAELRTSRCFVGWCDPAAILLGTESMKYNTTWTGYQGIENLLKAKEAQVGGGLGIGDLSPLQISLQVAKTYEYHSTIQRFPAAQQYEDAIRDLADQVAFVYDVESKRAWLVPSLSLLLYLCHLYFHTKKLDSTISCPIPFAEPSPDGAAAAEKVFRLHGDTTLDGMKGGGKPNLRQTLLRLHWSLHDTYKTREKPRGSKIFGSELMDVVQRPGTGSSLKSETLSSSGKAWVHLVDGADLVLFCSGLGEAIRPLNRREDTTCGCHKAPDDQNLMIAHNWCIEQIMKTKFGTTIQRLKNGVCSLGKDCEWRMETWPFNLCDHSPTEGYWESHPQVLQRLSSNETPSYLQFRRRAASPHPQAPSIAGAVVFGIPPPTKIQKRRHRQ
jgi:hypothetical protein